MIEAAFFGGVTRILHNPQELKINRDLGILLEILIQPEIATLLVFFFPHNISVTEQF